MGKLPWSRSWEKKLDALVARAKRAPSNLADLPSSPLTDQIRETGQIHRDDALQDPVGREAIRRSRALDQEHELHTSVRGCYVTVSTQRGGGKRFMLLAVSNLDKSRHGATSYESYPAVFDAIRTRVGAPKAAVAMSTQVVHWAWEIAEES